MAVSDYPYFYFGVKAKTHEVEDALKPTKNKAFGILSVKELAGASIVVGKSMDNEVKQAAMTACQGVGLKVIS